LWTFLAGASVRLLPAGAALWIAGRFIDRRTISSYGFRFSKRWWRDLSFGFGVGGLLMTLVFLVELGFGWVGVTSTFYSIRTSTGGFLLSIAVFLVVFCCAAVAEGVFARGYLITNVAEGLHGPSVPPRASVLLAWTLTSIVFGLAHWGNANATLLGTLNLMGAVVCFGAACVYTGELALPIGLHVSWNFLQANVFGFPVSGIAYPARVVTVFRTEASGPALVTGGAFGPEAGLLALLTLGAGILLILVWTRCGHRHDAAGVVARLAAAPAGRGAPSGFSCLPAPVGGRPPFVQSWKSGGERRREAGLFSARNDIYWVSTSLIDGLRPGRGTVGDVVDTGARAR
jgi:hypothetical protein